MSDMKGITNEKEVHSEDGGSTKRRFNYSLLYKIPISLILLFLLTMYLVTGIYTVEPKEVGVVTRFGKFSTTTGPGLHYHWPYPFEAVTIVNVTDVRRLEIGFRTIESGPKLQSKDVLEEATMLTGDLSIVQVEVAVNYSIKDAANFLFKVENPEQTVKDATEATLRQIVGQNTTDDVLTSEKASIQVKARNMLQEILDGYECGIFVEGFLLQEVRVPNEVQQAYWDVASAKEDKQKRINEAQAYQNQIIPKARGEASKILNEAEGYKAARIAESKGEVVRFEELLTRYQMGQEVTRVRLYLETMGKVLPKLNKIIVPDGDESVLKLLNLNQEKGGVE